MMDLDTAIRKGFLMCKALGQRIEKTEYASGMMAAMLRNDMGILRRLLFEVGIRHEDLPEMPYLEPEHLEAWKLKTERRNADREVRNG